ncbi:MAG: hypothetical protein WA691_07160 [Thermoplasmata archaeon]
MGLASFDSVDVTSLRWLRRTKSPLEFELLAGEQSLMTLTWKGGNAGSLTTARAAVGTWTLKRTGFLNPRVDVRVEGAPATVARLSVHWNYHRIDVPGGPSFRFHRAGILLPAWQITDPSGREVLHIEPVREGRKLVGGAVVAPSGARPAAFPLLVVVSWYFIVLAWFEDEALVPLEGADVPRAM